MIYPIGKKYSSLHQFFTLKTRIILIFVISMSVPFISITSVSYYAISSILTNKMQTGILTNLKQVQLSLENTFINLNHVSQQLSFQGTIGKQMEQYLVEKVPYDRFKLMDDMRNELTLISFTNPNVGLMMYYFEDDHTYLLENTPVKDDFSLEKLPLLAQYYKIAYYGPHMSYNRFNNQYVLSAIRKLELPDQENIYIYIESGFKLMQNIMDSDRADKNSFYLILDNSGKIAYSEIATGFPTEAIFQNPYESALFGLSQGYYWFKATGNQGWSVVTLIPEKEFDREKDRWINQIFLLALLFLLFGLVFAVLLWRMVYKPLNLFHKEIRWITDNNFHSQPIATKILEFDYLLEQLQQMKIKIRTLLDEVKDNEKTRANLEIEKLMYQINPHFLMNTLNTAHWLAVMNGQKEIDQLVQSLNKLLSYGLGKTGKNTTIQQEIDALKDYLTLQKIRYDFHYDIQIDVDEHVLEMPIPRFILQPIVENAIYHGLQDDGYIKVLVKLTEQVEISICDNGSGISEEKIQSLLNDQQVRQEKIGMGIGLNYVKRVLESHYGGLARLEIQSESKKGTDIKIILPIMEVSTAYDQSTCSR